MKTATTLRMLVRVVGLIMIVLGVIIWPGHADSLIHVHEVIGFVLVCSLLALAVLGSRAGAPAGVVVLAVLWCIGTPFLGLKQDDALTGGAHWVIQVVHLLVGVVAILLADNLAARITQAGSLTHQPA